MTVDITLFGATGFTGTLTAVYLGTHLPEGGTWAVAGRSAAKLQNVVDEVEAAGGTAPEIVLADVSDAASMRAMAEGTRVLISTVGPYVQHGDPAVRAAAEAGIAYVDLTGEPEFVDRTWLEHQETALRTGATLVHACGFDSIPYDLGVLYTVEQLPEGVPIDVKGYIRAGGTASGGTYHSAIGAFSRLRQSAATALLKLRAQGDGPSPEKRASSWFSLRLVGEGGGKRVVTQVSGGDPGYDETAKMLSESALCLAFDDVPKVAGQTTTAVAMGRPLIERLQAAGIRFETLETA